MQKLGKILSEILIDPYDQTELDLRHGDDGEWSSYSNKKGHNYTITNRTINFTEDSNYTDNFGDQWTRFPRLQLDSFNGTNISKQRFFSALSKTPDQLQGKLILDVGCGTGRFAEIALEAGAIVVGLDYSSAAYVAAENLKEHHNFVAIRGDIYNLPFRKNSFDLVYCLGVLQHTPNVEKAFKSLPPVVKDSGNLVVDYYWKRLQTVVCWKYLIRIITSRMPESKVLKLLNIVHPVLYPLSNMVSRVPFFGKMFSRMFPIVNYSNDYPQLKNELLRAWSFLDTYDNWAPKFDKPQTTKTITTWANDVGLQNVEVEHVGHLVVRGQVG